jgi:hypothetical protein
MVTSDHNACSKCGRRNPISYRVEPQEAWRTVVLNRWRIEAERAGVRYSFTKL